MKKNWMPQKGMIKMRKLKAKMKMKTTKISIHTTKVLPQKRFRCQQLKRTKLQRVPIKPGVPFSKRI